MTDSVVERVENGFEPPRRRPAAAAAPGAVVIQLRPSPICLMTKLTSAALMLAVRTAGIGRRIATIGFSEPNAGTKAREPHDPPSRRSELLLHASRRPPLVAKNRCSRGRRVIRCVLGTRRFSNKSFRSVTLASKQEGFRSWTSISPVPTAIRRWRFQPVWPGKPPSVRIAGASFRSRVYPANRRRRRCGKLRFAILRLVANSDRPDRLRGSRRLVNRGSASRRGARRVARPKRARADRGC